MTSGDPGLSQDDPYGVGAAHPPQQQTPSPPLSDRAYGEMIELESFFMGMGVRLWGNRDWGWVLGGWGWGGGEYVWKALWL